jgi:hypothetical protein
MKQTKAPITLKTLAAEDIYHLAEQFTHQHPRPKTTRGRNPLYPEALILTLALLQVAQQASYRQLLFGLAPQLLPTHALPALGTWLYRLQTLPEARWHALLTWLAEQGIALEQPAKPLEKPLVLVDGTGWGFDTPYYAQYRRGAEIRQMRSHGKGVVLGYWRGGAVWLVGASLGDAYANEAHLMAEWLDRYGAAGGTGLPVPCGEALWVGDKLYGRQARLLERVEAVGWLPVVRVAPSLYQSVRAPSRLRALGRLGEYGWALKERYRIEQVFGSVKRAYGSYMGCRRVAYVRVRVWGQLVLWNMVQYLRVRGGGIFLLCVGCGGCVMVVWWVEEEFSNTLSRGLDNTPHRQGILKGEGAGVVELVDTLDSGSSGLTPVGVRVPPPAPSHGGVAQLVRATGSYPVGRRFESARRYQPSSAFISARHTPPCPRHKQSRPVGRNASYTPCLWSGSPSEHAGATDSRTTSSSGRRSCSGSGDCPRISCNIFCTARAPISSNG